jgi:4-amino-4-deoxy-L-arabinose transferase-like glycosyltransferase
MQKFYSIKQPQKQIGLTLKNHTSRIQSLKIAGNANLKKLLSEYYPLLAILVAFFFVALSLGPYTNGDTIWEFEATSGVLKYGLPYANGSYLIDQPPVGFYIQAAFGSIFGLSIGNGVFLATLFGLGCVMLVYLLGATLYNKVTGCFAAALLAFSPWHLILSRAFLIDVQCLFFSLLSLGLAMFAFRRSSFRFFFASGLIFAVAFNTKLYAAFMLIPIIALFFYYRPKKAKPMLGWLAVFALPTLIFSFLWYNVVVGNTIGSISAHSDFIIQNPSGIVPSPFFVINFLASYGLGWFFADAVILSLIMSLALHKKYRSFLVIDLICLAVIICVVVADTCLGAGLNLKAPYQNAIKYCYQALPFFSLIGGSLVSKSLSLFSFSKEKECLKKTTFILGGAVGLALEFLALIYNMRYINIFTTGEFLIFRVEPTVNYGYSLFSFSPIAQNSLFMIGQYAGFIVGLTGLLWLSKNLFGDVIKCQK